MNRLTKKDPCINCEKENECRVNCKNEFYFYKEIKSKLGKLEDIMEDFKINSIDQLINILEAWEVCKKHMELYQSQQYILAKETTTKTSETIQARVFINDQKQVQTIIKALEVKDE